MGRGIKGSLGRGSVFRSVGKGSEGVLGRGLRERRSNKRGIEEQGEGKCNTSPRNVHAVLAMK